MMMMMNSSSNSNNTQTNSNGRQHYLRRFRIAVCLALSFSALSNVITLDTPLRQRFLSEPVVQDAQVFQITVTGVQDRIPTVAENMAFEAVLSDYLKESLFPNGVEIDSVRVEGGKTIHNRRSLNEKFSVAGEGFGSNGNIELDEETLTLIDDHDKRILGQVKGEDTKIHQISLLVWIKGSHLVSSGVTDYDELVMNAINRGSSKLVTPLIEPNKYISEKVAAYFKDIETIVCIGVGPRDDEPHLEVGDEKNQAVGQSSMGSSSSLKSLERDEVPISKLSRSYYQNERIHDLDSKKVISGFDDYDSYNADAVKFRQVSSVFFLVICSIAGLWYAAKIVAKKNEERRLKMSLAKKAYEGPRQGTNTALFNNGKFTGTMDTGAGM